MTKLLESIPVIAKDGTRVQVLFYEDGSLRFRVYNAPMVIAEAFLTGNAHDHTIIKLVKAH